MTITPQQPVGAEITDCKLSQFSPEQVRALVPLLAEHGVLAFREQYLSDGEFVDFLARLGPLTFTVGETPVPDHPDLNVVSNVGRKEKPRSRFHIDSSYFKKPPAYTALRAVVLPPTGGETLFTNQYRAYATLPREVRHGLAGRTLKHVVSGLNLFAHTTAETAADHPVFPVHPISGEQAIYLSTPARCISASGLPEAEARRYILAAYEHSTRPENTYRHYWRAGDVVIWDNGCTLHRADHSRVDGDRILHRGLCLGYNA